MTARGLSFAGLAIVGLAVLLWALGLGSSPGSYGSRTALGYAGLIGILEQRGMEVQVSRRPPLREDRDQYVRLLVEPLAVRSGQPGDGRLSRATLEDKMHNVPTILIFPKWLQVGRDVALVPEVEAQILSNILLVQRGKFPTFARHDGLESQKLTKPDHDAPLILFPQGLLHNFSGVEVLLRDGALVLLGQTMSNRYPDALFVFDPDLVSNHGLANANHAALMIPLIEQFVGDRTLLVDLSTWEPEETDLDDQGAGTRKPPERNRLFQPPFAYVWLAFALLVALGLWAFLGQAERTTVDPNDLMPPPSMARRLARFARLWARHVQPATIHDLYEAALLAQTCQRLGIRIQAQAGQGETSSTQASSTQVGDIQAGRRQGRLAALISLEATRHGTTRLKDWDAHPGARLKRLQDLRRILHDL